MFLKEKHVLSIRFLGAFHVSEDAEALKQRLLGEAAGATFDLLRVCSSVKKEDFRRFWVIFWPFLALLKVKFGECVSFLFVL